MEMVSYEAFFDLEVAVPHITEVCVYMSTCVCVYMCMCACACPSCLYIIEVCVCSLCMHVLISPVVIVDCGLPI